jgi:hypothetical protein
VPSRVKRKRALTGNRAPPSCKVPLYIDLDRPLHRATENGARCRFAPTLASDRRGLSPPGAMGDSIVLEVKTATSSVSLHDGLIAARRHCQRHNGGRY